MHSCTVFNELPSNKGKKFDECTFMKVLVRKSLANG